MYSQNYSKPLESYGRNFPVYQPAYKNNNWKAQDTKSFIDKKKEYVTKYPVELSFKKNQYQKASSNNFFYNENHQEENSHQIYADKNNNDYYKNYNPNHPPQNFNNNFYRNNIQYNYPIGHENNNRWNYKLVNADDYLKKNSNFKSKNILSVSPLLNMNNIKREENFKNIRQRNDDRISTHMALNNLQPLIDKQLYHRGNTLENNYIKNKSFPQSQNYIHLEEEKIIPRKLRFSEATINKFNMTGKKVN
jgi:hypothetical protein